MTHIFGGLGEIDRSLVVNAGVVFKIYYWLFNLAFILGLLASFYSATTVVAQGSFAGIVCWIILLPFALLFWFLMRITVKLPLEMIKILLKINDSIDENNQQAD